MTTDRASGLRAVGTTVNTQYYTPPDEPDLLLVVPAMGIVDRPELAKVNVAFQVNYARALGGRRCGVVVFMDHLFGQDAESRRVYAEELTVDAFFGVGLVVPSPLSRAIGSFFIGLSKPAMPTRLFKTVDDALQWLRSLRAEAS